MYKSLLTSLIVTLTALLSSCQKEYEPDPVRLSGASVYVVCEGSLGNGNSALTHYDADNRLAVEDVYPAVNGTAIGDVFQSMTRIGDAYFLCVNNSNKIIVVDRSTLTNTGMISIRKPRYILPVSDTKAYVSALFGNKLFVINPRTLSVTDSITMPHQNPEGMALVGNTAYICTWDTASADLYPINTTTDEAGPEILLPGRAPQEVLEDNEGMLWVLSGNKYSGAEAMLSRLDPTTGALLKSYSFGTADPLRPVFNKTKDTLYFIEVSYTGGAVNNGIYRMGIHDAALPAQAFIPAQGLQYFYGIGIHPASGYIYVADPVGFTQRGKVYIYKPDGTLVTTFSTGVGPGHFIFE